MHQRQHLLDPNLRQTQWLQRFLRIRFRILDFGYVFGGFRVEQLGLKDE